MGRVSTEDGPAFAPLKTTDDDDDAERAAGLRDGGPTSTRYRDDPRPSSGGDGGPPVKYSDAPEENPFDWGRRDSGGASRGEKENGENSETENLVGFNDYDIDDSGFAPVSLHDTDSEGTDDDGDEGSERERIRVKANKVLNQRIFDHVEDGEEDEDRIFVGGGWGRHGSQFSLCPRGPCSCCTRKDHPSYSLGPPKKESGMTRIVLLGASFLALMIGAGFLGYDAGLPADEEFENSTHAAAGEGDGDLAYPTHTRGEEWYQHGREWMQKEKQGMHMPRWKWDKKKDPGFKKPVFEAKTQSELLHLSEHIFQSCSERSLRTDKGRAACLSLCHGQYCCFERDPAFGSCVALENSYCFAYAACEAVVSDFMDNVAGGGEGGKGWSMSPMDNELLNDECSEENVATPSGRRDCEAMCDRHLCCFDPDKWGECSDDIAAQCRMYEGCGILVKEETVSEGKIANPPPPLEDGPTGALTRTFKDDCMSNNLYANWDVCKHHCSRFACCFSDGPDSCYDDEALECDEYYICEEFYINPPEGPGKGGAGAGGGSDIGFGGLLDHPVFQLPKFKAHTEEQLLDIAHDVFDACNTDTSEARGNCLKQCHGHYCCFERHVDFGSCVHMENSNCFAYEACENVVADFMDGVAGGRIGGETWTEKDDLLLWDECSPKDVATPDGRRDCEAFCEHFMCCFDEDQFGQCSEDRERMCEEYDSCSVLLDPSISGYVASPGIFDFKANCMANNLYDNWDICKNYCEDFQCCFSEEGSCYDVEELECDEHYICEEFNDFADVDDARLHNANARPATTAANAVVGKSPRNVDQDIANAVRAVCALADTAACEALCEDYLCCFSVHDDNCRHAIGDDICDSYQDCEVLMEGSFVGGGGGADRSLDVEAVEEACVPKASRDPRMAEKCRKACDKRKCCFGGPSSGDCLSRGEEWCEEFAACEILYT